MIKLAPLYFSQKVLKEKKLFSFKMEDYLEKVSKSLVENEKFISLISDYLDKNPEVFDPLEKKFGKSLPTNENTLDFNIPFNKVEDLSLKIVQNLDLELNEAFFDTLKIVITKSLKLLGLGSFEKMLMFVVKEFLQDGILDNLPRELLNQFSIESSGAVNQVALLLTICFTILTVVRNLKKKQLNLSK